MTATTEGVEKLSQQLRALAGIFDGEPMDEALFQGALVLEREVKVKIRDVGLIDTGNYRADVRSDKGVGEAVVGTNTVYGPIHEFGGNIPITAKSRRYFWARFRETGDGKWKGLALTRKSHITVRARPHWRPAIDTRKEAIARAIIKLLQAAINARVG